MRPVSLTPRRAQNLTVAILFLASICCICGCGGSSSTRSSQQTPPPPAPTMATVTFATPNSAPLPSAVATSTGDLSTWTLATVTSGQVPINLGTGKNYGVAFYCNNINLMIYEFAATDTLTPTFSCGSSSPFLTVTFNYAVTIPGASTAEIDVELPAGYGATSSTLSTLTGSTQITTAPSGSVDTILKAFDSSGFLLGVEILRAQSYTANQTVTLPTLSVSNTGVASVTAAAIPSGWTVSYPMNYVLADGARFQLGTQSNYGTIPASMSMAGDYYTGGAYATQGANSVSAAAATNQPPASVTLPAPMTFTPPTPADDPSFVFSYPTSGFTTTGTVVYVAGINWSTPVYVTMVGTANAVGANPTLKIPNLAPLSALFPNLPQGTTVNWNVGVIVENPLTLSNTPVLPFSAQDVTTSGTYSAP